MTDSNALIGQAPSHYRILSRLGDIWNMSLFKTMKFTERASLQFRFQTYDTFNHQNYSLGLPTKNGTIDQWLYEEGGEP